MAEQWYPKKDHTGSVGKSTRSWSEVHADKFVIPEISAPSGNPASNTGWLYVKDNGGTSALYFEDDGGTVTQVAATATAFDDIGDPDAAGTIALTTYKQIITGTNADDNIMHFQSLGNAGNVSSFKFEQKTGNPTDGTLVEIVVSDANMDPLVVSSSAQANALVVGQNAGTVSIAAAATVGGTLAVTGAQTLTGLTTCTAGAVLGVSKIITEKTDLTSAQVKALRATPIALTSAPGTDKFISLLGATLILDYGSNAFTESSDDLVIEYETSGVDATAAITSNGFLTATADTIAKAVPASIAGAAASSFNNKRLMLKNSGDGEIAGNAANDSQLTVIVTYAVHTLGLA